MKRVLRDGLVWAWVAPVSLCGLLVATLAQLTGSSCQARPRQQGVAGTLEVSGGRLGRWLQHATCVEAITLGHVIVGVSAERLACWRSHELAHVAQYERWGVLMPLLYGGDSARAWLQGRSAYLDNCFEREAFGVAQSLAAANAHLNSHHG